jgi:hypothetical protein
LTRLPQYLAWNFSSFTHVEPEVSTTQTPLSISDKEDKWLAVFSLISGVLASLWDVVLFPHQHRHVRARGASASSVLLPCKSGLQFSAETGTSQRKCGLTLSGVHSILIYKSLLGKSGAKSRFVNQIFLFRIYWHGFKICFRTCKSVLGFVSPFKDMEINFWTYKTLNTIWLQLPLKRREIYKSKAGC